MSSFNVEKRNARGTSRTVNPTFIVTFHCWMTLSDSFNFTLFSDNILNTCKKA